MSILVSKESPYRRDAPLKCIAHFAQIITYKCAPFYAHFMEPSLICMGRFSIDTLNLRSGEVMLYNQMSTSFGCAVDIFR